MQEDGGGKKLFLLAYIVPICLRVAAQLYIAAPCMHANKALPSPLPLIRPTVGVTACVPGVRFAHGQFFPFRPAPTLVVVQPARRSTPKGVHTHTRVGSSTSKSWLCVMDTPCVASKACGKSSENTSQHGWKGVAGGSCGYTTRQTYLSSLILNNSTQQSSSSTQHPCAHALRQTSQPPLSIPGAATPPSNHTSPVAPPMSSPLTPPQSPVMPSQHDRQRARRMVARCAAVSSPQPRTRPAPAPTCSFFCVAVTLSLVAALLIWAAMMRFRRSWGVSPGGPPPAPPAGLAAAPGPGVCTNNTHSTGRGAHGASHSMVCSLRRRVCGGHPGCRMAHG